DAADAPQAALLADLLAIPGAGEADGAGDLMPRDARIAMLQMLEALLVRDASRGPLLLVVEDLHWADPTTLELLERILARLPAAPVVCLLTFRTSFEPPWMRLRSSIEVELGPLDSENVRELAHAASPVPLDAEAIRRVESVTDGVPLFVEELVKVLA